MTVAKKKPKKVTPSRASRIVPTSLTVNTLAGTTEIPGSLIDGTGGTFGYYVGTHDGLYHVTHTPTGMAGAVCADKEDAEKIGKALFALMGKGAKSTDGKVAVSLIPKEVRTLFAVSLNLAKHKGATIQR